MDLQITPDTGLTGTGVATADLVRILGNLIDNAVDACRGDRRRTRSWSPSVVTVRERHGPDTLRYVRAGRPEVLYRLRDGGDGR